MKREEGVWGCVNFGDRKAKLRIEIRDVEGCLAADRRAVGKPTNEAETLKTSKRVSNLT